MTSAYYVPSGRLPARAVWLLLRCALAALPAAWVYAWLTMHLPLALAIVSTPVFAFGLGLATRYAARCGKARAPAAMGRLGIALGLAAWYAQAAAWISILEADGGSLAHYLADFVLVLTSPAHMAQVALDVLDVGVYSIAGLRMRGALLVAVWAAELALLVGAPYVLGRISAAEPFCEDADCWMQEIELPGKFDAVSQPAGLAALVASDPACFFTVFTPCRGADPSRHARLFVYLGKGDPFVSIKNVTVRIDQHDKRREAKELVIDYLRLPGIDAHAILRHGAEIQADAAAPAPEPAPMSKAAPAELPPLGAAIVHLHADRFGQALAAATPYLGARDDTLRRDAVRLCALCSARVGRWDDALRYWSMLFGEERSAHNALNVGTSFAMTGDPVHGRDWIARARTLNLASREMPDLQIVTSFIAALTRAGHLAQALPYLDEVREVYVGLHHTDPTFLILRHVPFFDAFLEHSAPVVHTVLGLERGHAWYASMLPHLDQHGKDELTAWLGAHALGATPSSETA